VYGIYSIGSIKKGIYKPIWRDEWFCYGQDSDRANKIVDVFIGINDGSVAFLVENTYWEDRDYNILVYNAQKDTVYYDENYVGFR
ncbi:MAG: hypothetical protein QME74_08930, partial [Candidatus Edwardsbacteria bacterium]|nr:hypothetical protein [Candidatus Edwardsbacteria bacterium]